MLEGHLEPVQPGMVPKATLEPPCADPAAAHRAQTSPLPLLPGPGLGRHAVPGACGSWAQLPPPSWDGSLDVHWLPIQRPAWGCPTANPGHVPALQLQGRLGKPLPSSQTRWVGYSPNSAGDQGGRGSRREQTRSRHPPVDAPRLGQPCLVSLSRSLSLCWCRSLHLE